MTDTVPRESTSVVCQWKCKIHYQNLWSEYSRELTGTDTDAETKASLMSEDAAALEFCILSS